MKWVRRTLLLVIAGVLVGLLVLAYRPKPVPVETAKVEQGEFREYVEEPARSGIL